MSNVKAVYGSVQDVGKLVKKSKKHFVWKFTIRGKDHLVELFVSFVSGKKKLRVDGKVLYESQKVLSMDFNYQFELEGNTFEITQRGEKFNMLINNQQFESLYGGGLNGYDDFGRPQQSYDYPQSRSGEKYGRSNTYRDNYANEEYSTRSQYNNRYENDKMGHWVDVRNAESHTRSTRRDYYDEDRQGGNRDNSYEDDRRAYNQRNEYEDQETKYSMRHHGRAKTYGPERDDFEGYDNKPRLSNHNQNSTKVQSEKTISFDDFDKFSNFDRVENKENRGSVMNSTSMRTQNQPQENMMDTRAQVKPNFFQQEVSMTTSRTVSQNNYSAYGTQKEESQAPSVPPSNMQTQQVQPATTTTTTLIDFATPTSNNLALLNDLYKAAPAPQVTTVDLLDQTQPQTQGQGQFNAFPPSNNMKKDLWQTDLVSLNSSEVNNNNNLMRTHSYNPQQQNYNNYNNFSTPMNNMYNTQNQMGMGMGMNNNMNMMNSNMNMGMGMNMGGYNGNMGMNHGNLGRMHSTLY